MRIVLLIATILTAGCGAGEEPVAAEAGGSVMEQYDPADPAASLATLQSGDSDSELQFETTDLDLGQLYQQNKYDVVFPFEVVGPDPVVITGIDRSCGCTDASIKVDGEPYDLEQPIPPGAKGEVVGVFSSSRYVNKKESTITVRGNAVNLPKRLQIRTFILPVFEMRPREAMFGDVQFGRSAENQLTRQIHVIAKEPFEIVRWINMPKGVSVTPTDRVEMTPDGKRQQRWFEVSLLNDAPMGRMYQTAIAETTLGNNLEFVIQANIFGPVKYLPEQRVTFGMVNQGQELMRRVNLQGTHESLVIPEPIVELEGDDVFQPVLETDTPGSKYVVKVKLRGDAEPGPHTATLKIRYPEDSGLPSHSMLVKAIVR